MKYVVFDVGGTEIKYSVMDEALSVSAQGTVSTPQSGQDEFLAVLHSIYEQHKAGTGGIAVSMPGIIDADAGFCHSGGARRSRPLPTTWPSRSTTYRCCWTSRRSPSAAASAARTHYWTLCAARRSGCSPPWPSPASGRRSRSCAARSTAVPTRSARCKAACTGAACRRRNNIERGMILTKRPGFLLYFAGPARYTESIK